MKTAQYHTLILQRRDRQTDVAICRKSQVIQQKLLNMPQINEAAQIFTYLNFRSEVQTTLFVDTLIAKGKNISVPLCHKKTHLLEAIAIESREQLTPGAWGIPEPLPQIIQNGRVSPAAIDIIIMPGAVFDLHGGRIGYGGGFYDRFVSQIPQAQRIAPAFELQLVPKLSLKPHDQLVDYIVTERRIIPTGRGKLVNPGTSL